PNERKAMRNTPFLSYGIGKGRQNTAMHKQSFAYDYQNQAKPH
ncbi:MAG: hypothetical protein K0S90_2537, partial [Enterobacteriaceae bacterium]|nr:hypothetical protein [Enterobacteriaceae bacterium]